MPFVKPGNRLYHYCKLETARDFILPSHNLLLNSIIKTNDPRENVDFVFRSTSIGMSHDDIQKNLKEVSRILRENCKVLCFAQDYNDKWGCASSPMWAHYGGNHTGVCLELDKIEFMKENPKIDWNLFKQINYFDFKIPTINDPPSSNPFGHRHIDLTIADKIGLGNYVHNTVKQKHLDYFYYSKNREWEYEREIRLVHFGDDTKQEFCSIKKSLANIHLGICFDDKQIPTLKSQVAGVDFYKLKYGDISLYSEQLP
ncbi:MAG: DUF2971 domain-containing protein [Bacteroidia bacterium]